MTEAPFTDPNDPLLVQGRRRARDLIRTARKIAAAAGDRSEAGALAAGLQLVIAGEMENGGDPRDAYRALIQTISWAVGRLPPSQQRNMFNTMFGEAAQQIETASKEASAVRS